MILFEGKPLIVDGKLALDTACCCGSIDCECCSAAPPALAIYVPSLALTIPLNFTASPIFPDPDAPAADVGCHWESPLIPRDCSGPNGLVTGLVATFYLSCRSHTFPYSPIDYWKLYLKVREFIDADYPSWTGYGYWYADTSAEELPPACPEFFESEHELFGGDEPAEPLQCFGTGESVYLRPAS